MLLTAMYSEEEADVTAKKIAESALCLQGKMLSKETIPRLRQSMFAFGTSVATRKVVRDGYETLREHTYP